MSKKLTTLTKRSALALLLTTGIAYGQSPMVTYFDANTSTLGNSLGGSTFSPSTSTFWTFGFGAGQSIRQLTAVGSNLNTITYDSASGQWKHAATSFDATILVGESDLTRYIRSSSLAGAGVTNPTTWSGQSIVGNVQLNPASLTIDGINYAPGTLMIAVDAANPSGTGTSASTSKTVYAYDMRQVGTKQADSPGRDRNTTNNATVDSNVITWNDVFTTIATRQDFMNVTGQTSDTNNLSRNFAFSKTNGKYLYIVDSSSQNGGLWKVDLERTSSQPLVRIAVGTADPQMNAEPVVVSTATRDLDLWDGLSGDQILTVNSSANGAGVSGGIGYFVHNPNTNVTSEARTLLPGARVQGFSGRAATGNFSTTVDDAGNFYLFDTGGTAAILKYDSQGRISKVVGLEQHTSYQVVTGPGTNNQYLDLSTRAVTAQNGSATFPVTEILYSDSGTRTPVGVLAFNPADLDRDGVITAADTAAFITQFNTTVSTGSPLSRGASTSERATYQNYLNADLNGSAVFATPGLTASAVDNRDLLTLFQFINKVAGDLNLDGVVSPAEITTVQNNAALNGGTGIAGNWFQGDVNRDGLVNAADVSLLAASGTTYNLDGFLAQGTYTGGATGNWSQILKSDSSAIDADTNLIIARAAGSTVAGPGANTSAVYVDLGTNQIGGPANTLNLASGVRIDLLEGMLIRPNGVLNGAGSTLRMGSSGVGATLAVLDGGQVNGNLTLEGSLDFNTSTSATFDGLIKNNGAILSTLKKVGAGTLTITQANTYTGTTTVAGGTLLINSIQTAATGAVAVSGGATLGGTGTIGGATTVSSSGVVAPGVSGAGTLSFNAGLSFSSGGVYQWQIASASTSNIGTNSDLIIVKGGTLVLGSGRALTMDFSALSTTGPDSGDSFWNSSRSWKIIDVQSPATNPSSTNFSLITNSGVGTGSFATTVGSGGDAGDIFLTYTPANVWTGADNANWTLNPSWSAGSVPNSTTATAMFSSSGGANVTLDTAQQLNKLTLDSATNYSINGNVTLTTSGNTPKISTLATNSGSQTIAVPLSLGANTTILVQGGTLNLNSPANSTVGTNVTARVATGATLTLGGNGNALSNGTTTHVNVTNNGTLAATAIDKRVGNIDGTGTTTVTTSGASLTANYVRQDGLTIGAGNTVTVAANGANSGTSVVTNLSINATGKLDLANNDLIVNNGNLAAVTALLASGLDIDGSYGNGPGITSSTFANNPNLNTVLGIAANSDLGYTSFSGQTVDTNDLLVKYTYFGDADLNGVVDTATDFDLFITGLTSGGSLGGWLFGDFDYNGTVDSASDFDLFITGLTSQSGTLLNAGGGSNLVQAVPEPGTVGLMAAGVLGGGLALLRRRRLLIR